MKDFIKPALLSLALNLVLTPLRYPGMIGFGPAALIAFTAFFLLTILCIKQYGKKSTLRVFLAIIVGNFIIFFEPLYAFSQGNFFFLPYLTTQTSAIFCGLFFVVKKTRLKFLPTVLCLAFAVFMWVDGYDYWMHYENFGTFTGRISPYQQTLVFDGIDANHRRISSDSITQKLVMLDFWNTRCSLCFKEFPKLQAFYDAHRNDTSLAIYAVNKPVLEDRVNEAFTSLQSRGFDFPILLPTDETLPEKFGVRVYPTVLVIDSAGVVVYKGNLDGAIKVISELN